MNVGYLKYGADEYSWCRPPEQTVIPAYHGQEISDEVWTWVELNVRGKHEVCCSRGPGNVPGNVDWIVQVQLLLVSCEVSGETLGFITVNQTLAQQRLVARNSGWDVIQVEEDVEGSKVSHQATLTAVSEIKEWSSSVQLIQKLFTLFKVYTHNRPPP